MALIDCPECGHRVSTAAISCPSCGHPILGNHAAPVKPDPAAPASVRTEAEIRLLPLSFGLTGTVVALLWATCAAFAAAAILSLEPMRAWRWGNPVDFVALNPSSESGMAIVTGLAYLLFLIGWVVFLIWFYQAYRSAASRGATNRGWGVGWTIGSWFIPAANLVLPKLVMNEVDRMSNPLTGEPPIENRWEAMPRLGMSDAWWLALVAGAACQVTGWYMFISAEYVDEAAYGVGLMAVVMTKVLYAAAAGFMAGVVLTVGGRLRGQP